MSSKTETITVALGSESVLKKMAVETAFQRIFSDCKIEIVTTNSDSGINDQPVGYTDTHLGAENRLNNTREKIYNCDYYVSIENGIMKNVDIWMDFAWVIVGYEDPTEPMGRIISTAIPFPEDLVEETRKKGFEKNTVGQLIADRSNGEAKSNDPHVYLTGVGRKDILEQAIRTALGLLICRKKN